MKRIGKSDISDSIRTFGSGGLFAVFYNHAPLISSLEKGEITFRHGADKEHLTIEGGFVEVLHNEVSVCATVAKCREKKP